MDKNFEHSIRQLLVLHFEELSLRLKDLPSDEAMVDLLPLFKRLFSVLTTVVRFYLVPDYAVNRFYSVMRSFDKLSAARKLTVRKVQKGLFDE